MKKQLFIDLGRYYNKNKMSVLNRLKKYGAYKTGYHFGRKYGNNPFAESAYLGFKRGRIKKLRKKKKKLNKTLIALVSGSALTGAYLGFKIGKRKNKKRS